ncbi:MAG: RNA polymerase sigma factor [Chloroflexota bacterium]
MDDRALAAAIVAGDAVALRHLIDRESGRLLRACVRVVGDVDAAADVVQETFIGAVAALPGYRGEGDLGHWLVRIAVRRALRTRRLDRGEPLERLDVAGSDDEPDNDILERERDHRIRDAVAALPEPYREMIVLRYFAELDPLAIASATGTPLETVRTRLRRGLARLRLELRDEVAA